MKPLHKELKEIRLEKGVTIEKINKIMKINISLLEKIEEGDFSVIPMPFLRAFLREYAEVLEIDPDRVIKRFENKVDYIREPKSPAPLSEKSEDRESAEREEDIRTEAAEKEPELTHEEPETTSEPDEMPEISEEDLDSTIEQEDITPGKSEPSAKDDLQPSLFEQAFESHEQVTKSGEDESETEVQTHEISEEPVEILDDRPSTETATPTEHQRLEIEEPGTRSTLFFVVFTIIIIIAAIIIFWITRGI